MFYHVSWCLEDIKSRIKETLIWKTSTPRRRFVCGDHCKSFPTFSKKSESSGGFRQPSSASHYWHLMHKDRKFWSQTDRERGEQQRQFGGEGCIQTAGYILSFLFLCSVWFHIHFACIQRWKWVGCSHLQLLLIHTPKYPKQNPPPK